MVVNFSRTYAIYDYIFIGGTKELDGGVPIERVASFKYLCTFFDDNLKWQSNTDYTYGKLRWNFYAVSRFKHFRPNKQQRDYFIQSLIKPILLYYFELWYNYATDTQKERLTKPFLQNSFDLDMDFYLECCVCKTVPILLLTQVIFNTAAIRPIANIIEHQKLLQTIFGQVCAIYHLSTIHLFPFFSFSFYMHRAPARSHPLNWAKIVFG